MSERFSYITDKEEDSSVVFKAFIRRDLPKLQINKNSYTVSNLMAETMGIYGACHMFLYILTLLFKRVYYMNSILRELFLMKTENQIVENGDPR